MKTKNYEAPDVALVQYLQVTVLCTSGLIEPLDENDYPGGDSWVETL